MSRPLLIAHRGAPGKGAVENTVRAFRDAIARGADGVEMDVRGTADGRLVVFHDDVALLPGGKRVPVRKLKLEDLRDPSLEVHDRVTSFEETLRAVLGRAGVVLEIKEPGLEESVAAAIASLKAGTRLPWLLVASFHPGVLEAIARHAPGLRRGLVVSPGGPGLGGALRGRMPLRAWRSSGAHDLLPSHGTVTAAMVDAVGKKGGRVIPWTVNTPEDAARVLEAGAAGVITDRLEVVPR